MIVCENVTGEQTVRLCFRPVDDTKVGAFEKVGNYGFESFSTEFSPVQGFIAERKAISPYGLFLVKPP